METKDTRIYMIVDTEKINSGNEDECVEFKDNRDNPNPKKDPRNFISLIDPGQKVFWFGEPKKQQRHTIEIIGIERKNANDPEFLTTKGNDPSHRGAYMAQVIDEKKDGLENYNIIFGIKDREGQFKVDPKLTMNI